MPIFNGTLFSINKKEMMRYAGLGGKAEFPEEKISVALCDAAALAEPKGIWQMYSYDAARAVVQSDTPLLLEGNAIRRHLSQSVSIILMAVTAGDEIEKASDDYFKEGNYVQGLLLDAAATAITEHIADQLEDFIKNEAARSGQKTMWRFSPGYSDWPITQQKALAGLIHAGEIGITVTDHSMLVPRKSVTAVIGLGPCARPAPLERCETCSLITCPFRNVKGDTYEII